VGVQALVSQRAFRLEEVSRQAAVLQQNNAQLKLQVADLAAPRRILEAARLLGLRPAYRSVTLTADPPARARFRAAGRRGYPPVAGRAP
jgi:hypothetical protein